MVLMRRLARPWPPIRKYNTAVFVSDSTTVYINISHGIYVYSFFELNYATFSIVGNTIMRTIESTLSTFSAKSII